MTLRARLTELATDESDIPGPELLPVRLARACATVLPFAAAGLSLYSTANFRVPIGASDDMAADAERLQFTLGEGPCLAAHSERRLIAATEADMQRLWPRFYDAIVSGTSYRSIVSVPLQQGLEGVAALDLYLTTPSAELKIDRAELVTVAETVTAILLAEPQQAGAGRGDGPAWLESPTARRRSTVWTAIGMVNVSLRLSTVDALAVLRASSYSHEITVDQLAEQLVSGQLQVDALFQET